MRADVTSVESIVKHILHHSTFEDVAHFSDVSYSFRIISNPDLESLFNVMMELQRQENETRNGHSPCGFRVF